MARAARNQGAVARVEQPAGAGGGSMAHGGLRRRDLRAWSCPRQPTKVARPACTERSAAAGRGGATTAWGAARGDRQL